jgi:hypothetical protein
MSRSSPTLAPFLVALVLGGCATLDTSRPVERTSFLFSTSYAQDGHILNYWSTSARLSEFDASRESAERSRQLQYSSMGAETLGVAMLLASPALPSMAKKPVALAGVGLCAVSLIPAFMSLNEYGRAIDAYNARFQVPPGP